MELYYAIMILLLSVTVAVVFDARDRGMFLGIMEKSLADSTIWDKGKERIRWRASQARRGQKQTSKVLFRISASHVIGPNLP